MMAAATATELRIGEGYSRLHTRCMQVSTSIRVSEATKEKLERLKGRDETFDELLARLAGEHEPVAVGAWSEEDATAAREAIDRSRESFER
jgi:hypothetical protein